MGEENAEKDAWTGDRARNMENENCSELRELYKNLAIVTDINKKKLEWIGLVVKRDQERTVEKIFESKPEGIRRRGRTRMGWMEDVGRSAGDGRLRHGDRRPSKGKNGLP